MKSTSKLLGALCCLVLQTLPMNASAYTECAVTPQRVFVGDGILWVVYLEGGAGIMSQSDNDFKATMAVIMLAITMQKSVVVRYVADGVSCASPPGVQDIAGIWLTR